LLFECIYIQEHLANPNLTILGICLEMQEYRMLDGWNRTRKRGSHRFEQVPTDIYEIVALQNRADFAAWVPEVCKTDFTAAEFSKAIGKNLYTGRAILKVLQKLEILTVSGKKGRTVLYSRTDPQQSTDPE